MISVLNENHLKGVSLLCKADQIEERGLCEFLNRQITHPDEEFLGCLVV